VARDLIVFPSSKTFAKFCSSAEKTGWTSYKKTVVLCLTTTSGNLHVEEAISMSCACE
jgi:hypothetical protein